MSIRATFHYFQGMECDMYSFYRIPKLLFTSEYFKNLSCEAKVLYGLMLESYNDCAVAIAEHIAGTTADFAAMMNDKAKEIGCEDSYFITPNGLDAKDEGGFHHTTAADLSLIMRYCIKGSKMAGQFLTITQKGNISFMIWMGKTVIPVTIIMRFCR